MLKKSSVVFDPVKHTYLLGEAYLKGISHIYGRFINPTKYEGIPESVLNKAAERGSMIHDSCRVADMVGHCSTEEARQYIELKKEKGISTIENEYIVSNELTHATAIDVVGDDYSLYDIKTTSKIDEDSLSWQLSICAYLFELQTGLKANKLFGIWLRNGKAQLVEVKRIETSKIEDILYCDYNNLPYVSEKSIVPKDVNSALQKLSDLETVIQSIELQIKEKEKESEDLKLFLLENMKKNGIKKWETDKILVSYVESYKRESIDSKKLKEKEPEIYKAYAKESEVKETIKIKLK